MKSKELTAARRLITKVQVDPRIKPGQRDQLRRLKRDLDMIARSGKLDRDRIFRVTAAMSAILLDVLDGDAK